MTTDRGQFDADAAIVTLPLGVLKDRAVRFDPPLPDRKLAAIDRLGVGLLAKVVVRFEKPFWPEDRYIFGYRCRPTSEGWPTFVIKLWRSHRIPALVMLVGGDHGRRIEAMDSADVETWAMKVLSDVFGDALPRPASIHRTDWERDPYARGAHSAMAVGASRADIECLAEPLDARLYFAGEATCAQHWATVHGAYVSGATAAAQILRDPSVLPAARYTENRRWRKMMMRSSRFLAAATDAVDAPEVQSRVAVLNRSEVFSRIRAHELRTLATLFSSHELSEGEILFRLDDPAQHVFVLMEGCIELTLRDRSTLQVEEGGVIGEYGMFGEGRRTATAVASSAARLLSLDYRVFQRFLLTFPEAMLALYELVVGRLVDSMNAGTRRRGTADGPPATR